MEDFEESNHIVVDGSADLCHSLHYSATPLSRSTIRFRSSIRETTIAILRNRPSFSRTRFVDPSLARRQEVDELLRSRVPLQVLQKNLLRIDVEARKIVTDQGAIELRGYYSEGAMSRVDPRDEKLALPCAKLTGCHNRASNSLAPQGQSFAPEARGDLFVCRVSQRLHPLVGSREEIANPKRLTAHS